MDTWRLLLLSFVVISTSECSVTSKLKCERYDVEEIRLLEGEAFYFRPYLFREGEKLPEGEFTWYRNGSKATIISSNKADRIHHQGEKLFFLNLLTEDSGLYISRHIDQSGECSMHFLAVHVFKPIHKNSQDLLFGEIEVSDDNIKVPCPVPVYNICHDLKGNFSWYRNFTRLHGEHKGHLWVINMRSNKDIYTCICTWTHNNSVYNSSGSRWVKASNKSVSNLQILSPSNHEVPAVEGSSIKLNCSALCGINLPEYMTCHASWNVAHMDGYNQTTTLINEETSLKTYSTAILTIDKVSDKDFKTIFNCTAVGFYKVVSATVTLKRRASIVPMVIGRLCIFFICVFAAVLVKCFAIDLALFFRPCLPASRHNKDGKIYDAYVVYQTQLMDKDTEDTLCQFVTKILPSVLEKKCGYRLFIHGRDDIPGEDHLEVVEDRIKQSRRLMIILTLDSKTQSMSTEKDPVSPQNSLIGGFDWQVGIHHVLMQREMNVILVQLGDTGPQAYTHLPPGLQHLIRKSAPIKWPQRSHGAAAWNSRFWKRVRYLMPAVPVAKYPQSAVV
ncbi:hypothetical protein Q5P01_013873 [Channa striata]|uniref:TIR domain-containing protein n=1 Tax=Channa striata TaxID=64152 RepID=A0AA88SJM1_CHASR|nr:hypothetical protein Q5P01_013873 [Channa striata]